MPLTLTSPAFIQGAAIPAKYTCDGANKSPPLRWDGVPRSTRSFLLVCNDPDAPSGLFHHWAAYNIPAEWRELDEGYGPTLTEGNVRQAINDFRKPGYAGPCPPAGDKPHHYHFRLSALSESTLPVETSAACDEVIEVAEPYVLDEVELIGVYGRQRKR
jgi:Raf kinase inhibitor-like YbhB/YbcL family protein